MRSALIVEWLIARFTSRRGAASVVGDLLETSSRKGIVGFWRSAAPVLFSLAWRPFLSFAAALGLGFFCFNALQGLIWGIDVTHRYPHGWRPLFAFLYVVGVLLSFGMPYTAIRYGLKDPFTRQIFAVWSLATILILFWWIPLFLPACAVLGIAGLIYSALSRPRRRVLVAVGVALVLSFACAALLSWYLTTRLYHISAAPAISHTTRMALKQIASAAFWLGWMVQPFIYSRVHRMFLADGGVEQPAV